MEKIFQNIFKFKKKNLKGGVKIWSNLVHVLVEGFPVRPKMLIWLTLIVGLKGAKIVPFFDSI